MSHIGSKTRAGGHTRQKSELGYRAGSIAGWVRWLSR